MATATGLTENTIYWHLKQIYQKKSFSRQVDLVRLVLSIAELGNCGAAGVLAGRSGCRPLSFFS